MNTPKIELDIASAVARIEQIAREGPDSCCGIILDRLITCDAPRLRRYLSIETLAILDEPW